VSLTGGHLDAFLEAGLTAEQIVALVKADIAEREKEAETRRAKDRERQRRHRESRGVTVTDAESQPVTDKGSPLKVSPQTPLPKTPSKTAPLNPPKSGKVEVPEWMPSQEWAAFKEMRRKMRGIPFTETAERNVIARIEGLRADGHCPAKLLSKAVERGHRTVFEDETTKAAKGEKKLTAQEWREKAEWYVRHGKPDFAEDCRRRAIELERQAA
jgi:hypothetical protein